MTKMFRQTDRCTGTQTETQMYRQTDGQTIGYVKAQKQEASEKRTCKYHVLLFLILKRPICALYIPVPSNIERCPFDLETRTC